MKRYSKALAALALAGALAGCAMGMGGRAWVPQGPGDQQKVETRNETAAAVRAAQAQQARNQQAAASAQAPAGATRAPSSPGVAAPIADPNLGGYTQATRYGDLLFVSGQIAMDLRANQMVGTTVEEQTRQVMENIRTILEAHRLTMANVVSVTVFMKDLNQFRAMNDTYETYFRSALPARSVVEASRLPRGALVEISVIAGR